MREFTLPYKPEELLAKPADGRLWAEDLPPVDDLSNDDINGELDALVGRILGSQGHDIAEDSTFSLMFALLQAWPRLDDATKPRVLDLLADTAKRLQGEVARIRKTAKLAKGSEQSACQSKAAVEARTACKVVVFFLRWAAERVMRKPPAEVSGGRGRGKKAASDEAQAAAEEAKEAHRILERQRVVILSEIANVLSRGHMAWLWASDGAAWQQLAAAVSDAGFLVLDSADAVKHRETRQCALRCVAEPLAQEGQQHSNLLIATVSKLIYGLRGGEAGAPFAADALLHAHATPLPRLLIIELTQNCMGPELSSQGAFQRSVAVFLVALAEKLPHLVLANISVLLPLLDIDCYPLRSAIVESIGQLLAAEGKKLPSGAHCGTTKAEEGAAAEEGAGEAQEGAFVAEPVQVGVDHATFNLATSTKKDLLETLLSRSLDKSVWVRYRVLQTLAALASHKNGNGLPKEQWCRVLEIATKRMQDLATSTRKAAMQLARALIEFHPFGPALQGCGDERAKAEQLLKEVHCRLRKLQAEEVADAEEAVAELEAGDEDAGATQEGGKRRRFASKTFTEQSVIGTVARDLATEEAGADPAGKQEDRKRQRDALMRMQDCYIQRVRFVELIDAAEARLRALLMSRTSGDVTEAISVVVELRIRGVPAAVRAADQVLGLVWSRHANVKDAAVEAFHKMHLESHASGAPGTALLELYQTGCASGDWTHTHLASVQELIQNSAEKGLVKVEAALPVLLNALHGATCLPALRALTALAVSPEGNTGLVAGVGQLQQIVGEAGISAPERLDRVRLLCQLVQRMQMSTRTIYSPETVSQLCVISQMATRAVVEHFSRAEVPAQWFGATQAAMDLSFELTSIAKDPTQLCPDKLWEQILSRMLRGLLGRGPSSAPAIADAVADDGETEGPDDGIVPIEAPVEIQTLSVPQLGCVVFMAGHLAMRMLVFLDGLQSALKKKRLKEEDTRMAEQRESKKQKKAAAVGKKGKGAKEEEDDPGAAEAMGMAGQEEREAEEFADLAENGLLYGARSLLNRVKPMLFACLLDTNLRTDPVLRRLGAVSLCKFMTVSKRFCQENLQLLFSVLFPKGQDTAVLTGQGFDEAAAAMAGHPGNTPMEDQTLRQSLLVAVGDLLFRHPNAVEPWTGRLYATLGGPMAVEDGSAQTDMRLTSLLVLTHLVLNDMIKPRSVLLVRALWLTACPHVPTSIVARILFQELSKRSTNVVYNLLPQIIASLPDHNNGDVRGGAEGRVQYIMQFVEKEKHIEGLIEKLTVRLERVANVAVGGTAAASTQMPAATQMVDEDAGMDGESAIPGRADETVACLAHALGSMNYSDRCIMRLHDAIVTRKALHTSISYHQVVRDCLMGVVEKARRPRPGKEKSADAPVDEAAAAPDGAAGGAKAGVSAAATAALDAIEQTITALAKGKSDESEAVVDVAAAAIVAPAVGSSRGGGRGGKKKAGAEADGDGDNPGFEQERGAGRGRGRGRGRGVEKENHKEVQKENQKENHPGNKAIVDPIKSAPPGALAVVKSAKPKPGGAPKRGRAAAVDDEE